MPVPATFSSRTREQPRLSSSCHRPYPLWHDGAELPYAGRPLVFGVHTFARQKNDYHLGPLFSDSHGVLTLTRHTLQLHARAEFGSGLMDYASIHDAFGFVERARCSAEQIARAVQTRTTTWTRLLEGEQELYASLNASPTRLRDAGNGALVPPGDASSRSVRDEWTDPTRNAEYTYVATRAAAA